MLLPDSLNTLCLNRVIRALCYLIAALPVSGNACGWWGDGEMNRTDTVVFSRADGEPVSGILSLETSKLPGKMGYGIVLPDPGRAVPYLQATYGRQISTIGDLKDYGFETVIDLGTPSETAHKHRQETESLGMRYFNIPVVGPMPSPEQTRYFSRMVIENSQHPLLVYAPTSALLGSMWASYRINLGAPVGFAIEEGKALGMMTDQEVELRRRIEKSGE